jgi:hypothetical protein
MISERGIEVDKAKVEAVEKIPPPTDIESLSSFLDSSSIFQRLQSR